jgi:hypothetical protein
VKITFIASNPSILEIREKPKPASELMPEWYKNMLPTQSPLKLNPQFNITAKKCLPLIDGLTAGYIVTLWADIFVSYDENNFPIIETAVSDLITEAWPLAISSTFEIPEGFQLPVFKYFHGWIPKTPKGYSCLITHPHGYQNNPFWTLTGVIDTDTLTTSANAPFVLRKNFRGLIPKGTPMFQILPFKRERWDANYEARTVLESYNEFEKLKTTITGSYGRYIRSKKEFK